MVPPAWFRLIRAGGFASACVALSQTGHDLMAARPAPLWSGWVALAGVGVVGYRLADRRRPAWWILLAVEVTQACLHLWFGACTPSGGAPVHLRMRGGAMHTSLAHAASHGAGTSPGMLAAHVLVGGLAAAWLYAGERALWRALRVLAEFLVIRSPRVFTLLVPSAPPRHRTGADGGEDEVAPAVVALRHVLVRRGPPRTRVVLPLS
jgi:hypothetical protein